jgi:hypothetical protein
LHLQDVLDVQQSAQTHRTVQQQPDVTVQQQQTNSTTPEVESARTRAATSAPRPALGISRNIQSWGVKGAGRLACALDLSFQAYLGRQRENFRLK